MSPKLGEVDDILEIGGTPDRRVLFGMRMRERQKTYHGLLGNWPRSNIHLPIGSGTPGVHSPRGLVIVDPGDVLRESERAASVDDSGTPGALEAGKKDAYPIVFHESRPVLETVHSSNYC